MVVCHRCSMKGMKHIRCFNYSDMPDTNLAFPTDGDKDGEPVKAVSARNS